MNPPAASLQIVRELPHEPSRVFSALTDPAKMSQWFIPLDNSRMKVTADLRPGGAYAFEKTADGKTAVTHGVYLEITPPRRLVFSWNSCCGGAENSTVTIELTPIAGGTRLVLTHALPAEAIPGHRAGWTSCCDHLEKFLGREISAPQPAGAGCA